MNFFVFFLAAMRAAYPRSGTVTPATDRDDIRTIGFVRDPSGAELRVISRLVDEGTLRPEVSAVYPLTEAHDAFMDKSAKHIPGKVTLTP